MLSRPEGGNAVAGYTSAPLLQARIRRMSVTTNVPITFQGLIQTLNQYWAQQGCVLISVSYTVRSTNSRFNMVFPFYLNEASAPGL